MGFGTVAANIILILTTIFLIVLVTYNMLNWLNTIVNVADYTTKNIKEKINKVVKITSVKYNTSANELLVNITNVGSESILLGKGVDIIIDYIDTNGYRHIEFKDYGKWIPLKVFIDNYTISLTSPTYIEFLPGTVCEIKISLNKQLDPLKPIIIIVALRHGSRAEFMASVEVV